MNLFRLLVSLAIAIGIATPGMLGHSEAAERKSAMQKYVDNMQPGWNLGNTFEAPGETAWGNPITSKDLVDRLVALGYKSIRIPVTWDGHLGEGPDYLIDKEYMSRVREVVDMALDAGLYVVLNLHHDSHWIGKMETEHDAVLAKFEALWKQIAEAFKDESDKLMFESINEPRFSDDWNKDAPEYFAMLEELNVSFHRIVRHSGGGNGKRPLVLPTLTASSSPARIEELGKTIAKLKDSRLIATIHFYGYYPFSVNLAGATTFDDEARTQLEQFFDLAYDEFVAKGIPVLVGEYGLLGFDKSTGTIEHGEMLKYFEYAGYYTHAKNMTTMLWDNGQHFDRRELKWADPSLYDIMSAGWKGRSSTAETDSIYIKKNEPVQDAVVNLVLNGNRFVDLYAGERKLTAGADYEASADRLTLKAALLESLMNGQFGENAALTVKFSSGADWAIHVILYDTPRLNSVKGNDTLFNIPALYNGDRVKAMEAVYANGGNAGPADWTPFKEYNYAFAPEYEEGELNLTPQFFKELKDGEVLLKVHFWSGAVLDYALTKSGTTIVGVSPTDPVHDETVVASPEPDGEGTATATVVPAEPSPTTVAPSETDQGGAMNGWLIVGLIALAAVAAGAGLYARGRKR
ncbi:cellulase family glycosylhydrolase [Cohnella suwonensis]|uniref:Cellulase family glycosylhydrolase n=1 Tax=Cohnella suwonensis TaxID=696072 RepID=A0ABW0LZC2_9BACL